MGPLTFHPKIRLLIEKAVNLHHRSMFFIYGEKSVEKVMYLHHLLLKSKSAEHLVKLRVLWCFRKLPFNKYNNKRRKQMKKKRAYRNYKMTREDAFDHFLLGAKIEFCHYSETERVLGQTFGMLIIQNFEALTPNTLARIVECVEGGGMIVFLLPEVSTLQDIFNLKMDAHSHYVTEAFPEVIPRFNKRFVLSLKTCKNCLVLDDALKIRLMPDEFETFLESPVNQVDETVCIEVPSKHKKCKELIKVLSLCCTSDQASALIKLWEALSDGGKLNVVSLTSGRGRGKSAVLGLALSLALTCTHSSICITSPHVENLKTLFSFAVKGLTALKFVESTDYNVSHTELNSVNFIVGIRTFRGCIRKVCYIPPMETQELRNVDLIIFDEAAAIPLPIVKKWIGPYTVLMSSTINGYEGTGRSLSLKLIAQLRIQSALQDTKNTTDTSKKRHILHEVELGEAIRYSNGDGVEEWFNRLLCLDAFCSPVDFASPQPDTCELYYVNKRALFGFNRIAEKFLQQMVSLFVTSHYKNSPNDLLMMADAPAHHVFCLLPPASMCTDPVPHVLCALQVAFEGRITEENYILEQSFGRRASGDLIPWIISQQFVDKKFSALSGARVVRIATHPDFQRMGYGKRALELFASFYSGSSGRGIPAEQGKIAPELNGNITLLIKMDDIPFAPLDYLGVSYGVTPELFRFWKKSGFAPFYLRQTKSELTGEHSCIMVKSLQPHVPWMSDFYSDFTRRFISLVTLTFRDLPVSLLLDIMHLDDLHQPKALIPEVSQWIFSPHDLERVRTYCTQQVDYRLLLDQLPLFAKLYFIGSFGSFLSSAQEGVLAAICLQDKSPEALKVELGLEVNEIMGCLRKSVQKILQKLESEEFLMGNQRKVDASQNHKPTLNAKSHNFVSQHSQSKRNRDPEDFHDSTSKKYKKFRKE